MDRDLSSVIFETEPNDQEQPRGSINPEQHEPEINQPIEQDEHNLASDIWNHLKMKMLNGIDFTSSMYEASKEEVTSTTSRRPRPRYQIIRDKMPSFTPAVCDNIVYATVDEVEPKFGAVKAFVLQVKADLKIGKEGYLRHVVLTGDQQISQLCLVIGI